VAGYDPKRTRRGPAADETPADDAVSQVDAILDRTSEGEIPAVPESPSIAETPAAVPEPPSVVPDAPPPVLPAPAPERGLQRVDVVAGVAAATVAAIWLLRRRRR
jgi:hypothetical protein